MEIKTLIYILTFGLFIIFFSCEDNTFPKPETISTEKKMVASNLNKKGLDYMQKGQLKSAIVEFSTAMAMDSSDAEYVNNLGVAYLMATQTIQAERMYRRATTISPRIARYHLNLGLALIKLKKKDEAIATLKEAARLKPDLRDAFYNMGLVYMSQKEYQNAARAWQRTARLKTDVNLEVNIGLAWFKSDNNKKAEIHFKNALALNGKNMKALFYIGRIRENQMKYQLALILYKKAIQLDNKQPEFFVRLAFVQKKLGQINDARLTLAQLKQIKKNKEATSKK